MSASKKDPLNELLVDKELKGSDVLEAAELTRTMASNREAISKVTNKPAIHFVPITEGEENAAYDSVKWLDDRDKAEQEKNAAREKAEQAEYRFYLKCRSAHHVIGGRTAPPHGVYFFKNPASDTVGDHDWEATYKKKEQVWRQAIVCQVCLKMGIEQPILSYQWQEAHRGLWIPDRRWVWKYPRDVKQWELEGDTRANDLQTQSSNLWREELEAKKAAKAVTS